MRARKINLHVKGMARLLPF